MAKDMTRDEAIDQLSHDVQTLRTDLAQLVSSLKDTGVAEGKHALSAANAKQEELRALLGDASDQAVRSAQGATESVETAVRDRPLTALLVAAGAGVLFGLATAKK